MTTQFPQIATTVPAEWLMKEADRRKMGDRIQELREESPYEQADMAQRLPSPKKSRKHMSTRMYQRIEERGTTKWEQVQKIAAIHAKHRGDDPKALAYWIWSGKERAATPDLMGALNGALGDQLNRIEKMLEEVHDQVLEDPVAEDAAQAADAAALQSRQGRSQSAPKRAAKGRRGKVAGGES